MTELTADVLLNLGFWNIGVWLPAKREGCLDYHLDGPRAEAAASLMIARNSLYAFVHGDEVQYIGRTARTIRERFVGYQNPGQSQKTNWRCNRNIRELLACGADVRIFVFNPVSQLRYGDFDINLAAGLEDALISAFNPPWNGRERGRAITEEAEREKVDEPAGPAGGEPDIPFASAPPGPLLSSAVPFKITLGTAYYDLGFINPGVAASEHLGGDGDPIEVAFDDGTDSVISCINRRANPSGSVRVVGRNRAIAEWFQKYFQKRDVVWARVENLNRIMLFSRPPST
jgi:hypothetical protein